MNFIKSIEIDNTSVEIKFGDFKYEDLVVDIERVRNYCREGCPNFGVNGGCPPFSPTADQLLKDKIFILAMGKIYTANYSKDEFDEADKSLNRLLKSIGLFFKEKYGVEFLSPEHCTECDVCTIKTGCQKPDRRTISITGTGIMLSETIENLFGEKLEWANDMLPSKLIKIMCIISDKLTEKIIEELKNLSIKNNF
ncbi:MAG: DUF2284 domain-containing protein [Caloramator sp.]|nr:DUF2284 domain-containing protein [Caloramator sp.]